MKKILLLFPFLAIRSFAPGQVAGNMNYQNPVRYPETSLNVPMPTNADVYLSVKGMANVKADAYVAIFSVTQNGKTAAEARDLLDTRLSQSVAEIKKLNGTETYVDMISFVPMYEYEADKKIFSKTNYTEIPAGFEVKKNLHIQFSDPNQLNDFISILAKNDIYDLVRVDYHSTALETVKKEMMAKAKIILDEKWKYYESLVKTTFDPSEVRLTDGFEMALPPEMYRSYEAYNSSSLNLRKAGNVNQANKSTTLYYQPVVNKEFDFVLNPVVLEPCIQILYEVKLIVDRKEASPGKELWLLTPNGDMKPVNPGK